MSDSPTRTPVSAPADRRLSSERPGRLAVVGGGLMGARVASRLADRGWSVTLYEAAPRLGGLASAWQLGPVVWDRHYHVTLLSDSFTRGLLREIGLEESIDWVETRTGFFADGRMVPMSSSLDYLRFPFLGPVAKARLAATILWASRLEHGRPLRKVPAERWLRRWSGDHTFERLWKPLLRCKLGEEYRNTAATFIWATIRRIYAARRTGLKKEMFGVVRGGYARVLERLAGHLRGKGVELCFGRPITRIERSGRGLEVEERDGRTATYDQVVVTTPPGLAARMCAGLSDAERDHLDRYRYQGLICASLLLRRPLSPYYLTYLNDEELPFTAIVEMSTIVDKHQLGGRSLVYLPRYTVPSDPMFGETDEAIQARFLAALQQVHPSLKDEEIECFRVSRVRSVFPIPRHDGPWDPPPLRASVPGLWFVNSAQVEDGTLNVNDTLRRAEEALEELRVAMPVPADGVPA